MPVVVSLDCLQHHGNLNWPQSGTHHIRRCLSAIWTGFFLFLLALHYLHHDRGLRHSQHSIQEQVYANKHVPTSMCRQVCAKELHCMHLGFSSLSCVQGLALPPLCPSAWRQLSTAEGRGPEAGTLPMRGLMGWGFAIERLCEGVSPPVQHC